MYVRMLVRLSYEYHASLTLVLHQFESATFSQIHHTLGLLYCLCIRIYSFIINKSKLLGIQKLCLS